MSASIRTAESCHHCAMLVPAEWPGDVVLESRALGPVDAARHIVVFTQILHADLGQRHRACLSESADWLHRLRSARRQLRIAAVDRDMYELWVRLLREAHDAVNGALSEEAPGVVDWERVRRGVRTAMNAVGWSDFGLDLDSAHNRLRITYPAAQKSVQRARASMFEQYLRNHLGGDVADGLDITFRRTGR